MSRGLRQKHIDLLTAVNKVPQGETFRPRDLTQKCGYPHKDAATLLQQSRILGVFVTYAPDLKLGIDPTSYIKEEMFDFWFKNLTQIT